MQQPVHHDHVGRSKLGRALFIEQSAMERAPRTKTPLCVVDVALVDVKTVVLNTGRQVLEDKSWPTSEIDDLISGFDGEVGTNRTHPSSEKSSHKLESLIHLRMSQHILKGHTVSILCFHVLE